MGAEHRVGSQSDRAAPETVDDEDISAMGPNERRAYLAAKRTVRPTEIHHCV